MSSSDGPPTGNAESGVLDRRYIKGIPAVLKCLEVVASLIAYICVEVASSCKKSTTDYFKFVSLFVFATCAILWVFLLLKLQKRVFRCDCINFPLLEFGFYVGCFIFYFFADLFLAIHACDAGQKAGCVFGFFAFFAITVDGVFALRAFLASRSEKAQKFDNQDALPPSDARY